MLLTSWLVVGDSYDPLSQITSFLEQLTELRKTVDLLFISLLEKDMIKATDETSRWKDVFARDVFAFYGWVGYLSTGTSVCS